jgi:hypothetical protein
MQKSPHSCSTSAGMDHDGDGGRDRDRAEDHEEAPTQLIEMFAKARFGRDMTHLG